MKTAPTFKIASAILVVFLSAVFDRARAADEEHISYIPDPTTEQNEGLILQWQYDLNGDLLPDLDIRTLSIPQTSYYLDCYLHFDGSVMRWQSEQYAWSPLSHENVGIEVPNAAYMRSTQKDYLSELVVYVVAVDSVSRAEITRDSAEIIYVAFNAVGDVIDYLDGVERTQKAPLGAYSQTEVDRLNQECGFAQEGSTEYLIVGVAPPDDENTDQDIVNADPLSEDNREE